MTWPTRFRRSLLFVLLSFVVSCSCAGSDVWAALQESGQETPNQQPEFPIVEWARETQELIESRLEWSPAEIAREDAGSSIMREVECGLTSSIKFQLAAEDDAATSRFSCVFYPQGDSEFGISSIASEDPLGVYFLPNEEEDGLIFRLVFVECNESGTPTRVVREHRLEGAPIGEWRIDYHEGLLVASSPDGELRYGFRYSQPANIVRVELKLSGANLAEAEHGVSEPSPVPNFAQRIPLAKAYASEQLYHKAVEEKRWLDALAAARDVSIPCTNILGSAHQYAINGDSFVAEALFETGRSQEAVDLETSIAERRLKELGPLHPNYASALENLAYRHRDMGNYESSIEVGEKSFAIYSITQGVTDQDSRDIQGSMAASEYSLGNLERSLARRELVVELTEAADDDEDLRKALIHQSLGQMVLGKEKEGQRSLARALEDCPLDQQVSLYALSGDYFKILGRFAESKQQHIHGVRIAREQQHDGRLERALRGLADLYDETYDLANELPVWLELRELQKRVYGTESSQVAKTTAEIAKAYQEMDKFDDALREAQIAAALVARIQGEETLDFANLLGIQALVYESRGLFAKAEPMARRACEITLTAGGPNHGDYTGALLDLSNIYSAMEDHTQAIQLRQEVIERYYESHGEDHPYTSTAMKSLSMTYRRIGLYEQSQQLMQKVLAIRQRVFGENHRYVADAYYTMSITALRELKYEEASDYLTRSMDIRARIFGPTSTEYLECQGTLGLLLHYQGKLDQAKEVYLAILERTDISNGDIDGDYSTVCENLGILHSALRDYEAAARYYQQSLELRESVARGGIGSFGERLQIELLDGLRIPLDGVISAESNLGGDMLEVYDRILFWKGAAAGVKVQSLDGLDEQLARDLDRLRQVRLQLSQIAFSSSDGEGELEHRDRLLNELTREKEALEADIARLSGGDDIQFNELSIQDIANCLEDDEAFLDFFQYSHHAQEGRDRQGYVKEQRLLAFVTKSNGATVCFELGSVTRIAELTSRFRESMRAAPTVAEQSRKRLGECVLDPIQSALDGVRKIIVSPDGPIAQLPLAILPFGENEYLIESYSTTYATSARQWLSQRSRNPEYADPSMVALGGVHYAADVAQRILSSEHAIPAEDLYLVGSEWELDQTSDLFESLYPASEIDVLSGTDATKSSLLASLEDPPRYLHVATHGLVRSGSIQRRDLTESDSLRGFKLKSKGSSSTESENEEPTVFVVDSLWVRLPRLRSALLLADERAAESATESGRVADDLLTAEEVMSLDLSSVEVVMLSACDTGLGDLQNGHGVIGLQRSFGMAGAQNIVGSLWAVDDAATSLLVAEFYRGLWIEKLAPAEALRKAQLYVLKNPGDIIELAGVLSGDIDSQIDGGSEATLDDLSPIAWWGSFVVYGE